ncbi:PIN domain nuclease [Halomicronema hongdechloris C2206]|uniref:Ribonuclease VapC n=1 Tax=Halomicronema hongdechloris C2206 TaxID=1641165 RepID=A0A1Z3HNE8_9CYAN|nr:type II toxin-antitoxin system VapC family toxin [Halomicronema hongdechloris]ASC71838.1 PIN domain nuclease [Halomicronema hongdechloris C2206]
MLRAVIDTHALIWYLYGDSRLSLTARNFIEQVAEAGDQLAVSAITLAEMVYLGERERINPQTLERLIAEMASESTLLVEIPLNVAAVLTLKDVPRDIVPELPDRIITATAVSLKLPIITRDRKIQASAISVIW